MFGSLGRAWNWLVDGLAEAVVAVVDRLALRDAIRIELDDTGAVVTGPGNAALGRLVAEGDAMRLEPPDLGKRLGGAALDVLVPPAWLFRRDLDPVAAQSAPYLDAFVRHQIDRITPWRVADVHYWIAHAPLPDDATRLSVTVGVVPKRLLKASLDTLQALRPKRLALVTRGTADEAPARIVLGDHPALRLARVRPFVVIGVVTLLLGLPGAAGAIWWETTLVQADIDEADRVIEERKAVLAAAARHDRAGTETDTALERLSAAQPRMVDILNDLSAALPDNAYLSDLSIDKDGIRLSGVSTATPQLVPALETSGRFTGASFFEATTRVETGTGDRFHIEMRAGRPRPGAGLGTAP